MYNIILNIYYIKEKIKRKKKIKKYFLHMLIN